MKRIFKVFFYSSQKELDKELYSLNFEKTENNVEKNNKTTFKNLLILGKEHFGKSKFLREILNKNFQEKLNINLLKEISYSDIHL